jgi:hypothetical protein
MKTLISFSRIVITCAGDIEEGAAWNGSTGLDKHLESSMDFAEHQRIAFKARKLLAGDLGVPDNAAGRKLKELKDAYEAGDANDVLYIAKGIHQPNINPHMQLQLKRGKSTWHTFHLNVSVSDVDIPGLPQKYFHWVGVQFTAIHGTQTACWPLNPVWDSKFNHARRHLSIAPKDIQATINAIANDNVLAEKKARDKAEREERERVAQANRVKISALLDKNFWTTSGIKNKQLDKLIAGETIAVTTKNRKTLNVKFENGTLKQA